MRPLLIDWLDYQRAHFRRKLRDVSRTGLLAQPIPGVPMSLLGLVRHMTQMEHVYLAWGLGGGERHLVYGEDDYGGGSVDTIEDDIGRWVAEIEKADRAITSMTDLGDPGLGHRRETGATLLKMVDEYAVHSGQAHLLRLAVLAG